MSFLSQFVYDWRFLAIRYNYYNNQFKRYYTAPSNSNVPHTNLLIYMQDDRILKGGLADRLRGMISMYAFCLEQGLSFKIYHHNPFNIEDYFEPNTYDWRIPSEDICLSTEVALPVRLACAVDKYHARVEQEVDFMKWYLNKFLKAHSDKELHLYTNARFVSSQQYSELFHELFKPTEQFKKVLNEERNKIGGEYLSVTLRFQNLLGDFYEGSFPTLPEREQIDLIDKVIKKIDSLCKPIINGRKVLVTADSRKFLNAVETLPYVYTIKGDLVHMSYTDKTGFQTHLKSFLDLLMLSESQKLFLLVTGNMYCSGFAKSASYINNKPYEEIIF